MHSGGSLIPSQPAMSVSIGIAALILEGRLLSDDYFSEFNSAQNSPSLVKQKSVPTTSDSLQDAHRIKQKLSQLRSCPGTSKDVAECSVMSDSMVSVSSADELDTDEDLLLYHQNHNKMDGLFLDSLQSLATTCLRTTPRTFNKTINLNKIRFGGGQDHRHSSQPNVLYSPQLSPPFFVEVVRRTTEPQTNATKKKTEGPKQGPHCDLFLKKIGLLKPMPISDDNNLCDDYHFCNEILNKTCRRWVFNTNQIKSILNHCEPICIEVFLGPEIKPILMEQWVIQLAEKPAQPTMTLQSLCSAIRSQLYFSQISSWTHLLKQESSDLADNPRIKTHFNKKPHLDIIYRIKSFKSVSSAFVDKPTVHNFPDTVISETASIRVCLKSAKRFEAIPKFEMCSGSNSPMMVDEQSRGSTKTCNEKGKHRCKKEYDDDVNECMSDGMGGGGGGSGMYSGGGLTSHRERQLLKYKKRLLKREKKKKMLSNGTNLDCIVQQQNFSIHGAINSIRPPLYMSVAAAAAAAAAASSSSASSSPNSSLDSIYGTAATQTPRVEMMSVATQTDDYFSQQRTSTISSASTATTMHKEDDVFYNFPSCDFCGSDMQCICWNCDNKLFSRSYNNNNNLKNGDLLLQSIHRTSSLRKSNNPPPHRSTYHQHHHNLSSTIDHDDNDDNNDDGGGGSDYGNGSDEDDSVTVVEVNHRNNRSGGGHCLSSSSFVLNGVKHGKHSSPPKSLSTTTHHRQQQQKNSNGERSSACDNLNNLDLIDCRSCIKRQKIKHNYNNNNLTVVNNNNTNNNNNSINNKCKKLSPTSLSSPKSPPHTTSFNNVIICNYRRTMSESISNAGSDNADGDGDVDYLIGRNRNEAPILSTSASNSMGLLSFDELKNYRRAFSEDVIDCFDNDDDGDNDDDNFDGLRAATNKCSCDSKATVIKLNETQHQTPKQKTTLNIHAIAAPIFVKCPTDATTVAQRRDELNLMGRSIPKLNLSSVFDLPSPTSSSVNSGACASAAIVAVNDHNNSLLVQKSYSAPSFNSQQLLSPRFYKQAAILKRRSRHLSDRSSERSSIGSEEHISDEEYGCGLDNTFSPVLSPNRQNGYLRLFGKSCGLRRRPLLGTLEESLLQNRIQPKFQVQGFKVLLGASGGFCPTQLTIPAVTNLYELQGETFSTPYTCEVRLPRKGYSIPITGTVQTTLLNPQGTVVRMFVVPYDFRDMPNISTTFIRQRVLTYDESVINKTGKSLEQLSNAEQMKLLRYAIHLRFQRSRSGRLSLHTDIKMLISRRTDCDTAAAHAKGILELPNELKIVTIQPENPKFSPKLDKIEKKPTF